MKARQANNNPITTQSFHGLTGMPAAEYCTCVIFYYGDTQSSYCMLGGPSDLFDSTSVFDFGRDALQCSTESRILVFIKLHGLSSFAILPSDFNTLNDRLCIYDRFSCIVSIGTIQTHRAGQRSLRDTCTPSMIVTRRVMPGMIFPAPRLTTLDNNLHMLTVSADKDSIGL